MHNDGGCLCGAIRYRIDSAFGRAVHCHCLDCRRSTGAPMVTWVEVPRAGFRWLSGEPKRHSVRPEVVREFCGSCGTQLTYLNRSRDETVDVTVASLDDINAVEPTEHLWFHRAPSWLRFDDGLPRYDRQREV